MPVKRRQGDFNIDVKDVSVQVLLTLSRNDTSKQLMVDKLDLDVAISGGAEVKFEKIAGRLSTVADLVLNQVEWNIDDVTDLRHSCVHGYTSAQSSLSRKNGKIHQAPNAQTSRKSWADARIHTLSYSRLTLILQ